MADDPVDAPNHPPPARSPHSGEPLWSIRKNHVTWSAELRYHGEFGVECQIFRNGEIVWGRRFDLKTQAVAWGESERKAIEAHDSLPSDDWNKALDRK